MRQVKLDTFFKGDSGKAEEHKKISEARESPSHVFKSVEEECPDNTSPCYLLSVTYNGKKKKALLKLYDPKNHKIYLWYDKYGHKPYFLTDIPPDKIKQIEKLVSHPSFERVEHIVKYDIIRDEKRVMSKIVMKDPQAVATARNYVPKAWEAKIKYHDNYIYDLGLIPGMLYKIERGLLKPVPTEISAEARELIRKSFKNDDERELAEKWIPLFETPPPKYRRVALDIEVYTPVRNRIPDPEKAREPIISIAFAGSDGFKKVLILLTEDLMARELGYSTIEEENVILEIFDSEKELLRECFRIISDYPVIVTFNGDNFDLKYLYNRAKRLGFRESDIPLNRAAGWMRVNRGIHIDLYKFFENKAIQVYAFAGKYKEFTLDAIASAFLKYHKIRLTALVSELSIGELAAYNFRDSKITLALTMFDNDLVMRLITLIMRISRMGMEDVVRRRVSAWIKNLFYWEHRRRGYLIPLAEEIIELKGDTVTEAVIKGKKYAGAIVLEPKPGIYFNVVVLDFASLYPSIIKTWNLSYETVNCSHEECMSNKIPETNHWVCTKRKGLTSLITGMLRDLRVLIYKRKAKDKKLPEEERAWYDVVQRAIKVYINASYGVFGSTSFPLYCPPAAESVTAIGRHTIKTAIKKATELGLNVIYGDTDSLFIEKPESEKIELLEKWVREEFGLDLEVDKEYVYVAFSSRKKNYLGLLIDGRVDVKGLVGKKRNTPEFLKNAFNEVLEELKNVHDIREFNRMKENIKKIIQEVYTKLKNREYTLEELAFRVGLTKELAEYTKNTPQHVKAALLLRREGIKIGKGDIISYVKVKGSTAVKPVQLAKLNEIDFEKYVSHIKTTFEQILDALDIDFDEILGSIRLEAFFS